MTRLPERILKIDRSVVLGLVVEYLETEGRVGVRTTPKAEGQQSNHDDRKKLVWS